MSDAHPSKKPVHCPQCGGFLFHVVITMDNPPTGNIGGIEDFKCPNRRCGFKTNVAIGVADGGSGEKTVESELRRKLQKESGD